MALKKKNDTNEMQINCSHKNYFNRAPNIKKLSFWNYIYNSSKTNSYESSSKSFGLDTTILVTLSVNDASFGRYGEIIPNHNVNDTLKLLFSRADRLEVGQCVKRIFLVICIGLLYRFNNVYYYYSFSSSKFLNINLEKL